MRGTHMVLPFFCAMTVILKLSLDAQKAHYDRLYNEAEMWLKANNPCQISCGKCVGRYKNDLGLCCEGCKHLTPSGCSVKSLACKIWLCSTVQWEHPEFGDALRKIEREARTLHIPLGFRMSKEENFGETNPAL